MVSQLLMEMLVKAKTDESVAEADQHRMLTQASGQRARRLGNWLRCHGFRIVVPIRGLLKQSAFGGASVGPTGSA